MLEARPRPLLAALLVACALAPAGSPAADHEAGAVVLVGGVLRYDNKAVWERIVELAGGAGARFVVVPTATVRPRLYGAYAVRALQRHGAFAELLPIAPETNEFGVGYRQAVQDSELVAKVMNADGVFFTGGTPQHISNTLYGADGNDTPMLAAIRDVYFEGGVIAGANASKTAVSTGSSALRVLQAGLPNQAIQRGLALLDKRWFVDQHIFTHGRFAVSLVAMRTLGIEYGLGIGVNAAVVITSGRHADVIGAGGAIVIDLSQSRSGERRTPFQLTGARLSYLGSGDSLDLATLRITPHASKLDGFEIDPNAVDYAPWFSGASFYDDIFAGSALANLIFSAIDGSERQGVGLAFAEDSATDEAGFVFRFYPGTNSYGWFNMGSGGEDYTVSNIRVDVRPVTHADTHMLIEGHGSEK